MPSGSYNREKGHTFERFCAKFFRGAGWTTAARNLREVVGRHAIRHHDLENTYPFAVQCKNTEARAGDRQLISGIKTDRRGPWCPLLIRKRNNCTPTVTLRIEDLFELLHALHVEGEEGHLQDTTLVTLQLAEFRPLLLALKKAGLYAKDSHD
jgi:hypothetical protein